MSVTADLSAVDEARQVQDVMLISLNRQEGLLARKMVRLIESGRFALCFLALLALPQMCFAKPDLRVEPYPQGDKKLIDFLQVKRKKQLSEQLCSSLFSPNLRGTTFLAYKVVEVHEEAQGLSAFIWVKGANLLRNGDEFKCFATYNQLVKVSIA